MLVAILMASTRQPRTRAPVGSETYPVSSASSEASAVPQERDTKQTKQHTTAKTRCMRAPTTICFSATAFLGYSRSRGDLYHFGMWECQRDPAAAGASAYHVRIGARCRREAILSLAHSGCAVHGRERPRGLLNRRGSRRKELCQLPNHVARRRLGIQPESYPSHLCLHDIGVFYVRTNHDGIDCFTLAYIQHLAHAETFPGSVPREHEFADEPGGRPGCEVDH